MEQQGQPKIKTLDTNKATSMDEDEIEVENNARNLKQSLNANFEDL